MWGDLQCGGPGNRLTASLLLNSLNSHPHPPPAPRAGARESEREDQFSGARTWSPAGRSREEIIMANVRVIQRNAHLAGDVRLEYVNGRDGQIAKATLTAISNVALGQRRSARGGGHRDPVDAVGQAGRERRRVPGQGQPRQHRRAGAQQQLREGRRDRLRPGLHLPRRSTTSTAKAEARSTARRRGFVDEMNASEQPSRPRASGARRPRRMRRAAALDQPSAAPV